MQTTKTLTCKFKDSEGRIRSIAVDSPDDFVDKQTVKEFMNAAITHNVLQLDLTDELIVLASIHSAEITARTTTDINLADEPAE